MSGGRTMDPHDDDDDDVEVALGARRVVAACHGILTRSDRPTWPRKFQRWMNARDPRTFVLADHYFSLPLPRWNWIKNRFLARSLATTLAEWGEDGAEIHLVGHSNGAAVVVRVARMLADRGLPVESVTLIGAATSCRPDRSGVARLLREGWLGRACAFWSRSDAVIGSPPALTFYPYGRLGAMGWRDKDGRPVIAPSLFGVEFVGFAHSTYFEPWQVESTFQEVERVIAGTASEKRFTREG